MMSRAELKTIFLDAAILLGILGFCFWGASFNASSLMAGKIALITGGIWSVLAIAFAIGTFLRFRAGKKYLPLFQWLDMMKFKMWRSAERKDVSFFLKKYTLDGYPADTIKPVICPQCDGDVFEAFYADNCGEVKCYQCGHQRFLLDSEEHWDGEHIQFSCPKCGNLKVHLWIGLAHRDTGDIQWVYVVFRCPSCNALDIMVEWKIDYGPTDEMEKKIYNPDWKQ